MTIFSNYQQTTFIKNNNSLLSINKFVNFNENSYFYFLNNEQFIILKSLITINSITNNIIIKQNDKYIILKLYINQQNFYYLSFLTF